MSRKFTLSTPRKNEERKRQEMKVNRVGRPPKVKWVPTISRGSQQPVQAPQVRTPLVRAPLVRAQTPQVRAPRPQVGTSTSSSTSGTSSSTSGTSSSTSSTSSSTSGTSSAANGTSSTGTTSSGTVQKFCDTSIALCILFSVCVLPCLRAHEFAAEQGQSAHCIMDCATFRLLQGGVARGLYFSSCHPVHQHPV